MAENSSGFVDYSTYADLNADEESRLMDEAYARAQEADEKARTELTRAYQGTRGMGTEVDGLSKSASYSDYLKAADDAKKAWAAIFKDGADPRTSALRGQLRGARGTREQMDASAAELDAREAELGKRVGEDFAGAKANRDRIAAHYQAEKDAKEKRANDEKAFTDAYRAGLWSKYQNARGTHRASGSDGQLLARYVEQAGAAPDKYKPYVAGDSWGAEFEDLSGEGRGMMSGYGMTGRAQKPGQAKTQDQQTVEANPWFDDEES